MSEPKSSAEAYGIFVIPYHWITEQDLDLIDKALKFDAGGSTSVDIFALVEKDYAQLWRISLEDGAYGVMVTQIIDQPIGPELFVWVIAGNKLWKHGQEMQDQLHDFAKSMSCVQVRSLARPAAARAIVKFGYRPHSICMIRRVKNGRRQRQ